MWVFLKVYGVNCFVRLHDVSHCSNHVSKGVLPKMDVFCCFFWREFGFHKEIFSVSLESSFLSGFFNHHGDVLDKTGSKAQNDWFLVM